MNILPGASDVTCPKCHSSEFKFSGVSESEDSVTKEWHKSWAFTCVHCKHMVYIGTDANALQTD